MTEVLSLFSEHFDYVLLFFLRVSGILILSPIFGRRNVPSPAKIGFCLALTLVFLTATDAHIISYAYNNLIEYILICMKELLFGAAMGYVTTCVFNLTFIAGSLMDTQLGLSMASVYDMQTNSQVPIVGNLFNIVLLVSFFAMDGHLKLIDILYGTIELVPIGRVTVPQNIMLAAGEVFSLSFVLAAMVAMPILASGVILEVVMGVMIRTVPQMNMFVVGIPVKVIVGLFILIFASAMFVNFSNTIFSYMFNEINGMFSLLGGTA